MKEILLTLYRTAFFYFFVLLMYRLMGKREIAQLGVVDLMISLLIAELVAISIENLDKSIFLVVVPVSLLTLLEIGLDYISLKSKKFRNIFEGKTALIITNGKVNYKEMVKNRYTMDNLLFELRQKGIKSLENIDYALLEANGKLSIFEKNKNDKDYPLPIILDGKIQYTTLKDIHKSKFWLDYMLNKNNIRIDDVFYSFYSKHKLFIIKRKDLINIE